MNNKIENDKITAVSNLFIDEYLPGAEPFYVSVYIYALRMSRAGNAFDLNTLSDVFGADEADVAFAWEYWEKTGLVKIISKPSYEIAFIESPAAQPKAITVIKPVEAEDEKEAEAVRTSATQSYSVEEIERISQNSESVRYLLKMAEKMLGKPLTYNEMNLFIGFYDWLSLPVEVIEVILDYCVSNNRKNGRYMEKVALDWADNGIKTVEDAEAYIKTFNTDYREIMKSFGLGRRDPSPKESAYMRKWLKELKMPLELVTEACGKTVLQTGQPKFSYADKILVSWHENDVSTLEEALALEAEFRKNGERSDPLKAAVRRKTAKTKSRFANYEGRDWDYTTLEKLAQDYVENVSM